MVSWTPFSASTVNEDSLVSMLKIIPSTFAIEGASEATKSSFPSVSSTESPTWSTAEPAMVSSASTFTSSRLKVFVLPSINWTVTSPETESTFYRIPVTSAASAFCGFALGRLVPCKSVLCRSAQPTAAATVIRPISIPAIFVSGKKCIRLRFITSYPSGWIFSYLLPCGAFSALFPGVDANSWELAVNYRIAF